MTSYDHLIHVPLQPILGLQETRAEPTDGGPVSQ